MNTGGSFVLKDGKRVLKEQTKTQATLSHNEKIAAATPKTPVTKATKNKVTAKELSNEV
jgi:hypothetical protein